MLRVKPIYFYFVIAVQLLLTGTCSSGITAKKGVFGAFCFLQGNFKHTNKSVIVIRCLFFAECNKDLMF